MSSYEFLTNNAASDFYRDCAASYVPGTAAALAQRVIDGHCHVYADRIAQKAVKAIDRFYEGLPTTHHDGTVGTLVRQGSAQGVSEYVVHSVATRPSQVHTINAYFASLKEDPAWEGQLITLGTLHPESETPEQDFEELVSLGLRGVKIHPDIQKFEADCPAAMHIFEMCESAGIPVLVHTGDFRYDYSNPARIARVLRAFPRLKMIGAHFGGWSVWDEAVRTLSDFPNLTVDSSSSFFWMSPQQAKETIRAYGSERIIFGTDYPMWNREPEFEYLRRLDLSAEEYEDICWRTCRTQYRFSMEERDV